MIFDIYTILSHPASSLVGAVLGFAAGHYSRLGLIKRVEFNDAADVVFSEAWRRYTHEISQGHYQD